MRWGAVAGLVMLAFAAGLLWRNQPAVAPAGIPHAEIQPISSTPRQRDRILLVVLSEHLDQSERILVELANLDAGASADITAERRRAEALLAGNRLYRHSAEERGQENVATLLDDLEPVLLQIAHSPSRLSAEELRRIQKRVEDKGLVLKLRVVRSNVRATSAANRQQPNV